MTTKRDSKGRFVKRSTADKARFLVLVKGMSVSEAAKQLGVRFQQVRNAVVTFKAA
jgi:transposase-like protein